MSDIISGTKARELIEKHNALLIDVRNPPEFASGSAPGAENVPVDAIAHLAKAHNPDTHIILFCMTGARSSMAQMILNSLGFENVSNVGSAKNFVNS